MIYRGKGIELEIVFLVEPRAFKDLQRQPCATSEGERIDRKLHVSVCLLPGLWLVVENMQAAVSDLQEINVACHDFCFEAEIESVVAIIRKVSGREIDRYFHGDGHRIVDEHEALERFMPHTVVQGCR